jgi:RimJ/RimL family protein N-acetyltransferase
MAEQQSLLVTVPVLETTRLRLRGHRLDDFSYCAALWGDPAVTKYIGGKPLSQEEAWVRLLRYVGHWALLGFGYWVIEEKSSGAFLGEGGFAENQREIEPSLRGMLETGWVFFPSAHGKGYATEAVLAMHAWKDLKFPEKKVACIVDAPNLASLRVAEKCGYRETARTSYKGTSLLVLLREPPTEGS